MGIRECIELYTISLVLVENINRLLILSVSVIVISILTGFVENKYT